MARTTKLPRAAPAIASALSSDIETSATSMPATARHKAAGGADGDNHSDGQARISSRNIFKHTHNSNRPPASVRPMIEKSSLRSPANTDLSATAPEPPDDRLAAGLRDAGSRQGNHDGVI